MLSVSMLPKGFAFAALGWCTEVLLLWLLPLLSPLDFSGWGFGFLPAFTLTLEPENFQGSVVKQCTCACVVANIRKAWTLVSSGLFLTTCMWLGAMP